MNHVNRTTFSALALGIAGVLAMGQAQASGFQLRETSVKNLGRGQAGVATARDDASVVSNNPAAMVNLDKNTVQADVTVIDVSFGFDGSGTSGAGTPLTGGDGGDPGDPTVVPNLAAVFPMHGALEGLTFGASIGAPFGLKAEYDRDWVGRYNAVKSDLKTVDFTLSAALKVHDRFSVGLGFIYERADVTLSKSVDFGSLLFGNPATRPLPFARPQAAAGFAEIQGDDNGFGWTVGANFKPVDQLAIGVSYRSEIDYELEGTADWTVPGNVAAVFAASPTTRPLFQDGAALAKLTTPSVLNVDLRYDFNDSFSMMASYAETGWSSLREVRIEFANPDPDSVEPFNWKDTTFASLGAEYKLNESWTLRGGVAYDETPTHIETRTPRLPDANRMWYSIGASWLATQALEVNFGYTRIEPNSPKIDITSNRTTLVGPFDGAANLYGVSAQYKF